MGEEKKGNTYVGWEGWGDGNTSIGTMVLAMVVKEEGKCRMPMVANQKRQNNKNRHSKWEGFEEAKPFHRWEKR